MIKTGAVKPQWKRRLTIAKDVLRRRMGASSRDTVEIAALSYKSFESLGTERRVAILADGEPLAEFKLDERGYLTVELQAIETYGLRVIVNKPEGVALDHDDSSASHHLIEIG